MLRTDLNQPAKQSKRAAQLAFGLVLSLGIASASLACASSRTENISSIKFSVSASVDWDKDLLGDGVQFTVRPLDDSGFLVRDDLLVNAEVWKQQADSENSDNLTLIQDWKGISITKKDFDKYGAEIRLEFTNYIPSPPDNGVLFVEAFTPDGRKFSFQESNVRLGYYNILNINTTCAPGAGSSCCPTK